MKNCPWFSLRSNSIESRFRSIRRGNFLVNTIWNSIKSKSNSEFASLINFLCSLRSTEKQIKSVRTLRDALQLKFYGKRELVIREKA